MLYKKKNYQWYKKGVIVLLFLLSTQLGIASHVVGGDITVKWISGNDFEITAHVYRDCSSFSNAFLDASITIGIYDLKNDTAAMPPFSAAILFPVDTLKLGDMCYVPDGVCVQEGTYKTTITLPNNPNGWYLSWQRWARNYGISNILSNGSPTYAGITLYVEIPDPELRNSTPTFGNYPNAYMCINQTNTKDFSAVDIDEDSLVYSLITPLSCNGNANVAIPNPSPKPYPNIVWAALYNLTNIIGGTPPMSINSNTGIITANPNAIGLFTFAVRVEEYDKKTKTKIGEIRRDVQYQVIATCVANVPPEFTSQVATSYTIVGVDSVCFNLAFRSNNGLQDSVFISATSEAFFPKSASGVSEPKIIFSPVKAMTSATTIFCLQTECANMRKAPYRVTFTGKDSSCYGVDVVNLNVDFYVTTLDGYLNDPIPNVFTPNGDKMNDLLKVNAEPNNCFDTFFMKIYDRWGNLVYQATDFRFEWDGTHFKSDKDLPSGIYFYALEGNFIDNTVKRNGTVTIVR